MLELLRNLCEINAPSGEEFRAAEFVAEQIRGHCEVQVDPLGNLIAFKRGKRRSARRLMLDAHLDEVGVMIRFITADGYLKFQTLGGIETAALLGKRVVINDSVFGVIGAKPIHLLDADAAKTLPDPGELAIDIGAKSREDALKWVKPGDCGVLYEPFTVCGGRILSKAIDDRAGCAVLIRLLREESEFDFYAAFTTGEEIGLRGARTAAYTVNPESALVIEATTASDIAGVPEEKTVCRLGGGAVVSFMDRGTLYHKPYYQAALDSGILCQPKCAVAGGNNAGAIHLSRSGVRTAAISVPCRYIHTASSVAELTDIEAVYALTRYMVEAIGSGSLDK